jgi:hypothetical protein
MGNYRMDLVSRSTVVMGMLDKSNSACFFMLLMTHRLQLVLLYHLLEDSLPILVTFA